MKCPHCGKQLLTGKQIQAAVLYCRMNIDDIAEILGISKQAVSQRLCSAYRKFPFLQAFLKECQRPPKMLSYDDIRTNGVLRKF